MNAIAQKIQDLSRRFYDTKSERDFNRLCVSISPIIYNTSIQILKDHDNASTNVNDVLLKIYDSITGNMKNPMCREFVYKDTPFIAYVNTIAHNKALMKFNANKKNKLVLESTCEEDESNQLVDVLPTSSKEYFDLNGAEYLMQIGDATTNMGRLHKIEITEGIVEIRPVKRKQIVETELFSISIKKESGWKLFRENVDKETMDEILDMLAANGILPENVFAKCTNKDKDVIPNRVIHKIKTLYADVIRTLSFLNADKNVIQIKLDDILLMACYETGANESKIMQFDESHQIKFLSGFISKLWMEKTSPGLKKAINVEPEPDFEILKHMNDGMASKYEKIVDIIKQFNNRDVLLDAMANLDNYRAVAEKHGKTTSSAIKTRVFRCKKIINRIMDGDNLIDKIKNDNYKHTGEVKIYYHNGKLKMCGQMIDSVRDGKFTYFYENGTAKSIKNYAMGEMDGEYKQFNKSGSIIVDGIFTNGLKHGLWKYYESNVLTFKADFYKGTPGYFEKISNKQIERDIYDGHKDNILHSLID